ncbi:putative glucuronosyltransferase sqv-8 [Rhodotorula toruloides ATCC 204091]|uniref:Putative glucuronosyltransferase sqv-8 n=1 Tax=Rhodotorula toruloides TaxID=5286 RepID=A0A0K3CQK3_RHOTO|nr:putative glucuronosyltransferase sqv-8 [Rhodotorula toruloides ATCC 204091]KAK4330656.1 putative glucuronosyltransferase sqv-8 [Rhodotorula toruloides]PRQ70785.1 putative glucuronosyltransferase sqv-8 [Rhodotorula toruloides]
MNTRTRLYTLILAALTLAAVLVHSLTRSSSSSRILIVTPTHDQLTRYPNFLYLAHALAHSPPSSRILWLVIEDGPTLDPSISSLLSSLPIAHRYWPVQTPSSFEAPHRGLVQRNAALDYIDASGIQGVVYFADDDNAYRPELLNYLSKVPRDGYTVFPVGNTGYMGFEGPVFRPTNEEGVVEIEQWCCDFCRRRWNVDMAGLAFHSSLLRPPSGPIEDWDQPRFDPASEEGFLETDLLTSLELHPSSNLYTFPPLNDRIHVWHNYGRPFHRAGYYDADWETKSALERKLVDGEEDVARGFRWAAEEGLPRAKVLKGRR